MRKIHLLYYIAIVSVFLSCEKRVDLDLDTIEPRLVIDASLSPSDSSLYSGCYVILTKTQNFYATEMPKPISNGTVSLIDNDANKTFMLTYDIESGKYVTSATIVSGKSYTVKVEYEGSEYSATETVPTSVPISYIYFIRITMNKDDDPYIIPTIVYNDPPVERNYYSDILYINDKKMPTIYFQDDEYKNGEVMKKSLFFDSSNNNDEELKIGDNVKVIMSSLAYGSYYYLQTQYSVAAGGATNPISNFSGGVLGYLRAHADSSIEITISASDIEDK